MVTKKTSEMSRISQIKKVKIMNQLYELKFVTEREISDANENLRDKSHKIKNIEDGYYFGLCDMSKNIIYINKEVPASRQRVVFLHELNHAIVWEFGSSGRDYDNQPFNEELVVDTFAQAQIQIMRDNKRLYQILLEEL